MVVTIFSIISILIVLLFFLNKIRMTRIPINYFFTWIKWYVTALMVYYALSANQYYLKGMSQAMMDGINLALLTVISFGMILYIHEHSLEKQRQQKIEELTIACALMEKELRQKQANSKDKE